MLRNLKIVIAWLAIMALGIFVVMNTQAVALRMPFDIGLHAPLSLVILATALLGALGASGFRTIGRWARGRERRATPLPLAETTRPVPQSTPSATVDPL